MTTPQEYAQLSDKAATEARRMVARAPRQTEVAAVVHALEGVRLAILASLEPEDDSQAFDEADHEEAERQLREGIAKSLKDR